MRHFLLAVFLAVFTISVAEATPSLVEKVKDGVWEVRDDNGQWGGTTHGMTHMSKSPYQARKILDLTNVPPAVWQQVKSVRLSVYFMVRDYSWHSLPKANGLDESYEFVINGKVHRYPDNDGAPVYAEGKPSTIAWYDTVLPKDEFKRGPNVIIIRKAPGKGDDFLYLGIDNTQDRGNSSVTFDGKTWTQKKLTVPGGTGEYMVRLYLITRNTGTTVRWQPAQQTALHDPDHLVLYAGSHYGRVDPNGMRLQSGQSARMEWNPLALDLLEPLEVQVDHTGGLKFSWLDENGQALPATSATASPFTTELPARRQQRVSGLVLTASGGPATIKEVTVDASLSYHPLPEKIDMCPPIAPRQAPYHKRDAACLFDDHTITMENSATPSDEGLRCRFDTTGGHLRLTSLYNYCTDTEMVRDPAQVDLFLVEVNGKRYAGSRDFHLASLKRDKLGFTAVLTLPKPALKATFTATMTPEGLRMGMDLANSGAKPVDFKLAFPHLAGLTASGHPAQDYYFFPWGGGIIADTPAVLCRGYGDYEAMYQVMDLFSPERGAGLYIRADDSEGWHKTLALCKYIPGQIEVDGQRTLVRTTDEYKWTNPFEPVEGVGFAYTYLRRTRQPGASFSPAPAVLAAHFGDWHTAMRAYADWAHRVWKFRPFPSKLAGVNNMLAAGWGHGMLFKDGAYRTDFIKPRTDCIELMSWWDWSPLGPWGTPIDKVAKVLGEATYKRWLPYFVKDPVTGKLMWNNQPGDYDGYNKRFGGLPAFRKAIQTYQKMGALVTLYTDPFRMDASSKIGKKYGKLWGVVGPDGKLTTSYDVYNPCYDIPAVRQWLADTMGRVMRQTGADGIRLDEVGHRGWVCFSTTHEHTYEERGVSEWNKAVADAVRMVHAAMDKVRPGLVLTTEHPGYDYLMQYIEGCITYDLSGQAFQLRPLECNLQRFYFPECKPYELDNRGLDPEFHKKFWNAEGSFGSYYPLNMYTILKENQDVYQTGQADPLIRTAASAQYVYVNRFAGGGKVMYHLYNDTGHTFAGPALTVTLRPDEHVFDLLNDQEAKLTKRDGAHADVSFYLPRKGIACVARLRRRLTVTRQGRNLQVTAQTPAAGCQLVVADLQGRELASQPAADGDNTVSLAKLAAGAKPAVVKLMRNGEMVDIAAVPVR